MVKNKVVIIGKSKNYMKRITAFLNGATDIVVIGTCHSQKEAKEALTLLNPDLVLLNWDFSSNKCNEIDFV